MQRAASSRGSAASLHDSGVAELIAGRPDRGVADLRRAVELRPDDGGLWTDLAAADLDRFEATGDPNELLAGLDAANRAVEREPGGVVARFNRALALERFSLRALALAEWQVVALRETDPAWRREAELRAADLARPAAGRADGADPEGVAPALAQRSLAEVRAEAARSPAAWRQWAEETLLARWAAAAGSAHREPAGRLLDLARAIGAALAASCDERMLADTVAQIDSSERTPALVQRLAVGLLGYRQGLDLIAAGQFGKALLVLRQARATLARAGSPFAGWAAYQVAFCRYQELDYPAAQRDLAELLRQLAPGRYRVLAGRAQLLAGLIWAIVGRHREAMAAYDLARGSLRRVEQGALAARASALLADEQANLGQRSAAWRTLYPALVDPAVWDRPALRQLCCVIAAAIAFAGGEVEVALQFHDEVVRNAVRLGQPYRIAGALRSRAALLAALGRGSAARTDLGRAWQYWRDIPDAATRRTMEGDLRLVEGTLAKRAAPDQALAAFDRAIELLRSTSYHSRLAQALFARATVERAAGRTAEVERDLLDSLTESERQRETISSPEDRISYLEQMREALDTLIEIELAAGRVREALAVSERGKARVLWDWMVAGAGVRSAPAVPPPAPLAPEDLAGLAKELPESTSVFEYAVLRDRTVVWYLRRDQPIHCGSLPLGGAVLGARVRQFRSSILERPAAPNEAAFQGQAERLYEDLIRPVSELIRPGERLVFVPDGALQVLPFNLLRDRDRHRFLIEDHAVVVVPSLRVLAACCRRDGLLARPSAGRMLVVSAPDFDRALGPALAPLSGMDTRFGGMFPGSRVLSAGAATASAFLRLAGSYEIVHFAGHSLVNAESPLSSRLLLARNPSAPAEEVLYSGEVMRARFTRTRLVVLASCSTALGRISTTEGVASLARPFLAAGAPVVVASLWDTDDRLTHELFARFYRALGQRFDAAAALQSAEREMIDQGSPAGRAPASWAAFEVFGLGSCDAGRPAAGR